MTRGIIFDYGGTLDTRGEHWSEVLWRGYQAAGVPVGKERFREAYVHAERELARHPHILPHHNMLDLLRIKVALQLAHLGLPADERVARWCYDHVLQVMDESRPVVRELAARFPLALVSNFYGNIHTILRDFRMEFFQSVVESAVVGVRKPDPAIFALGVQALGLPPRDVLVVGDSYAKDIVPAASLGCRTVWLRGRGWADEQVDEALPTHIITRLPELLLFVDE